MPLTMMLRWLMKLKLAAFMTRALSVCALLITTACGDEGSINFHPGVSVSRDRSSSISYVPGSEALVYQQGFGPTTGYRGKVQFNPNQGTVLTGATGHRLRLQHTVRNR